MTIVIGVIAIMAMIAYPNINNITNDAQKTVSDLNEKTIQQASIMGEALDNNVVNESSETDISSIGDLQDITVSYTGSDSLYLLTSTDGSTWYSYRDILNISKNQILAAKNKVAVNSSDKEDVINKGLTETLFNSLNTTDWNNVFGENDTIYFAYYTEDSNGVNTTIDNSSKISLDIVGSSDSIYLDSFKSETDFSWKYSLSLNNDYIAIDDFYDNKTISEFTVESWIKTTDTEGIIVTYDRSEYWRFGIGSMGSGGYITMNLSASDYQGSTYVSDGNWHHLAGVYDNGNLRIYVDGELKDNKSVKDAYYDSVKRYAFAGVGSEATTYNGERTPYEYLDAQIKELRVWDIALSETEIKNNMYNSLNPNTSGLRINYPFDEGSGNKVLEKVDNNYDHIQGNNFKWVEDVPN
jgi:Tfp pilus assembly protein FimT